MVAKGVEGYLQKNRLLRGEGVCKGLPRFFIPYEAA